MGLRVNVPNTSHLCICGERDFSSLAVEEWVKIYSVCEHLECSILPYSYPYSILIYNTAIYVTSSLIFEVIIVPIHQLLQACKGIRDRVSNLK